MYMYYDIKSHKCFWVVRKRTVSPPFLRTARCTARRLCSVYPFTSPQKTARTVVGVTHSATPTTVFLSGALGRLPLSSGRRPSRWRRGSQRYGAPSGAASPRGPSPPGPPQTVQTYGGPRPALTNVILPRSVVFCDNCPPLFLVPVATGSRPVADDNTEAEISGR